MLKFNNPFLLIVIATFSMSFHNNGDRNSDSVINSRDSHFVGEVSSLERLTLTKASGMLSETWTSSDIGNVGVPGSTTIENGVLTIQGSGNDIWNTSDGFHYYYKSITGDIDAIAKIEDITNQHAWTKAGIMIRATDAANSPHLMTVLSASSGAGFQGRLETGGQTLGFIANGVSSPTWVRIQRTGNTFRSYHSEDGQTWTQIGSQVDLSLPAEVLIGFCITSRVNNTLATATITETNLMDLGGGVTIPEAPTNMSANLHSQNEVELTWNDNSDNEDGFVIERKAGTGNFEVLDTTAANTTTYTDLTISPGNSYTYRVSTFNEAGSSGYAETGEIDVPVEGDSWISADIGSVGAPGSTTIANGTLIIQGSGNDIWNTSDGFHYYYKSITGDIDAIAKIESITNQHAWTKAGIMIRASDAANSPHLMTVVSASSGAGFQGRLEAGGETLGFVANGVSAPAWVRIRRTGNTFRSYHSQDGQTWTQIGSQVDLSLPSEVLIGFCITSRVNNTLATATITETNILDLGEGLTLPEAPQLTAELLNQDSIRLTWNEDANIQGYLLERKINEGNFTLLDSIAAPATAHIDTEVTVGNQYTYRIKGYNQAGESGYSGEVNIDNPVIVSLETPTDFLVYSISESAIKIKWTDVSNGQDEFEIHRDDDGDGVTDKVLHIFAGITETVDSLLDEGITYTYKVRAARGNSYSEFTGNKSAIPTFSGHISDDTEFEALMGLFNSTQGNNWTNKSNWGKRDIPFDQWYGLQVTNGDVFVLSLPDNNLFGVVPESIGLLKKLEHIDLSSNSISYVADKIGELDNLYSLSLSNCSLDSLPSGLGNLETPYVNLDFSSNNLKVIPFELIYISSLYIDISDNYLEFEDLDPYFDSVTGPANGTYVYSPQNTMHTDTVLINGNTVVDAVLVSHYGNNIYQWQFYVGSSWQDIDGANEYEYQPTFDGFYRCNVTSSVLTDLILFSPIYEKTGSNVSDSIEYEALMALYNATGGENWQINTNWGNPDVIFDAWHGVTVVNGDVIEINLPANNLKGTIPRSIHLLEALKVINFSDNQIKGELPVQLARLPELEALYLNDNELDGVMDLEFSVMPKLKTIHLQNNNFRSIPDYSFNGEVDKSQVTLKAENNKLEFLYIENNLGLPTPLQSFTYIPQKPYGEPKIMGFIAGNNMELKVKMLGLANVYQWERYTGSTWTTIGTNSPNYEKANTATTDAGRYRCRISNTNEGTGFEIVTEEIEVKVDGGITTEIGGVSVINRPEN